MSDTKVQKIVIDYIKDKEKLKISWKIDNKRKQKVTIDYYKDLEKHINVLEQVLNQLNWKLVIKGDFFTDCEYDNCIHRKLNIAAGRAVERSSNSHYWNQETSVRSYRDYNLLYSFISYILYLLYKYNNNTNV